MKSVSPTPAPTRATVLFRFMASSVFVLPTSRCIAPGWPHKTSVKTGPCASECREGRNPCRAGQTSRSTRKNLVPESPDFAEIPENAHILRDGLAPSLGKRGHDDCSIELA